MILDIRGTSGSGKSHTVHHLFGEHPPHEAYQVEHEGHLAIVQETRVADLSVFVLGEYDKVCGGCDGIPTQDLIQLCVEEFADKGTVILEGLLVSHTFGRWNDLAVKLHPIPYKFLFLDTPEQTCIDRVLARRKAKGNDKEYDPKNLVKDWYQNRRVAEKLVHAGRDVTWLNHQTAPMDVLRMLRGE